MKRSLEATVPLRVRKRETHSGVTAIVVAAGIGRRMACGATGAGRKAGARSGKRAPEAGEKVFAILGRRPLLFYSLKALEVSPEIERVVIVARKGSLEECRELAGRFGFRKVQAVVAGGKRRQDSVENGLNFVGGSRFVLIHDGARPFLSRRLVNRIVAACKKTGAAIAAVPVTETVDKVTRGAVDKSVPRENLWAVQTPQVFRTRIIEEAFRRWPRGSVATDDASMVKRIKRKISVVEGDTFNIKVTFPGDLVLAESLLRLNKKPWE